MHIGLEENGQCEDRDSNGTIDTSTGLGDVLAWTDASGARGVATAADECIVHYTQVNSQGTRHVSVDANNDVWVSGIVLAELRPGEGRPVRHAAVRHDHSLGDSPWDSAATAA